MFSSVMFYDEYAYGKDKTLKKMFKDRKFKDSFYVLALSDFSNRPEFFNADMLNQDFYKDNDVYVVGLCKDEEAAYVLVTHMVHNCINALGELDFTKYFDTILMQHESVTFIVDSEGNERVKYS